MPSTLERRSVRTRAASVVTASLLVAGLAGCTSDEEVPEGGAPVVQLGAPGESGATLSPEEVEDIEGPTYTDADVAFVQGMIPHHRQALDLTALVADRAADPDLAVMAERIEVSQVDEIALMERWLTSRGEDVAGEHAGHSDGQHGMPGMLTPKELTRLEQARGARFDRLFLQFMIRHHEGAVVMVESLLTQGDGGQESEVFQLASDVGIDQQVEIAAMKRQLSEMAG